MKKSYPFSSVLALMLAASALTCIVTVLVVGILYNANAANTDAVRQYGALLDKIGEVYIGDYSVEDVSAAAMRAAVEELGDRWSYYMTPQEYAVYLDSTNNRFAGIGVGVATDDTSAGVKVLYVYKDSPAQAAGIVAGDTITAVDDKSTVGIGIDDMRALLSRHIDETAELTVLRADGMSQKLTVVYSYVFIDPVSSEMIDGDIGYIALSNFDSGAADSFISAADSLIGQGAKSFIFDVRSNGGGRVDELTKILDYLLPEGEIFVTVDKSGKEEVTMSGPDMIDLPAVVMVDANSYSAAEYFAATLREYGYAQVVGVQTTGKNRMQRTYEMPGGGALHISSSEYLTKNRVSLYDTGGLTPDYPVSLTDDQYASLMAGTLSFDDDPQLQKAIGILRSRSS